MGYRIHFADGTDTKQLMAALRALYGVQRNEMVVASTGDPRSRCASTATVVVTPGVGDGRYGCRLFAGAAFDEYTGHLSARRLAAALCVVCHTQALVAGGRTGWLLVTEVVVDDDVILEEGVVIVAALAAIPLMPEIPVRTAAWCRERLPPEV